MALKLSKVLGRRPESWLAMQRNFDMRKAKSEIDGISFLPTLIGKPTNQKTHKYLYWEFDEQGGKIAVRKGNWKAVKRNILSDPMAALELYDLSKDIHEDNNVASKNEDIVTEMNQIMKCVIKDSKVFSFN